MKFLERWNPSVKAFTVIICVILLSFQYLISLNLIVFTLSLLFLLVGSKTTWKKVCALLVPAFSAALGLFIMGLYYARGNSVNVTEMSSISAVPYILRSAASQNLYTALQLSTRLLSYAGFGIMFALSTEGEYFISSLNHQCRLSPKFAYGILAAFHLLPNMVKEMNTVRLAFQVRGVHLTPLSMKPVFTMLVNSIHWSECVAMAMESKGFTGKRDRTYYEKPVVTVWDILLALFFIVGIALGMIFLKK